MAGLSLEIFGTTAVACLLVSAGIFFLENLGIALQRMSLAWGWLLAGAQAVEEIVTQEDSNNSGKIGDLVPPKVIHHFVNTNVSVPREVVPINGIELPKEKLIEFIHRQAGIGIRREDWLGDGKAKSPLLWSTGEKITQREFEAAIEVVETLPGAIVGGRNNRRVAMSADEILRGLELN